MGRTLITDGIENALLIIQEKYDEKLTVEGISAEIFFSSFYFSRVFQKVTGTTPSHYIRALRLFEAKRLLVTTSMTVSDVVTSVGYSSVGTFTSRFLRDTGLTPTQLRDPEVGRLLAAVGPGFGRMPSCELAMTAKWPTTGRPTGSIVGDIQIPDDAVPADVLIGVFDSVVPQREPVACQALRRAGSSEVFIQNVPRGRWYVIAIAAPSPAMPGCEPHLLGVSRAVVVSPGRTAAAHVQMHTPRLTDPPIATLIAPPPTARRHQFIAPSGIRWPALTGLSTRPV